jgi:hypothetical protein
VSLAEQFMAVFAGLDRAYGTYSKDLTANAKGKRTGKATMERDQVTLELWQQHLDGERGLGIVPIRDDNTVVFGVFDVDDYEINHVKLIGRLEAAGLPFIVCRTKSAGAHCYLFCTEPVTAVAMRKRLQEVVNFLGLPPMTEIFPKQEKMASEKDCGSFINVPYMGGLRGMRYAIKPNGDAISPEEFLEFVETRRVAPEWFENSLTFTTAETPAETPEAAAAGGTCCSDGPPCLQSLAVSGVPDGTRNAVMTEFAKYAKRKCGKQWKKEVGLINERIMMPPLEHSEVETVCGSIGRHAYNYTCKSPVLKALCNSALCRTREYGILEAGSKGVAKFGELRKLLTDPPIFFLDVEGKTIELTTEQLQSPKLFQRRCIEVANIASPIPKQADWTVIISDLLGRLNNDTLLPAPADASLEGQMMALVESFCVGKARGTNAEELLLGKPWEHDGQISFRLQDLLRYLNVNGFKDFKPHKVGAVLHHKNWGNATTGSVMVRGREVPVYHLTSFGEQITGVAVPEGVTEGKVF